MSEASEQPAPRRSIQSRWQFWAAIGLVLVAVVATVSVLQNSDSAKTSDMREWLADVHKFDEKYEDLGTATYEDGNVTVVASLEWADPAYGGYFLCAWVEPWLRDLGHGGKDSQIIVEMGGREVLRSRGPQESCLDAEPQV